MNAVNYKQIMGIKYWHSHTLHFTQVTVCFVVQIADKQSALEDLYSGLLATAVKVSKSRHKLTTKF